MWQCGIQSRKIARGQARRMEPSTLQFTEHIAKIFIDQSQCLFQAIHFSWLGPVLLVRCLADRGSTGVSLLLRTFIKLLGAQGSPSSGSLLIL